MEKSNGLSLELIVHPGETIKELLNDKNMNQEELAIRTGYSAKHISEVLSGKKSISSKFANSLEYVFNIPTEFWINLQGIYDKELLELEKLNNIKEEEFIILNELKDIVKYCENYNIIDKHFISNMGDIKKAKEYKKLDYFSNKNLVLKGAVSKNSEDLSQPIYTREMIDKMSVDEYLLHEPMIMEQLKTQGIPSEKQINKQSNLAGFLNQISGNSNIFTREDIKNMTTDEYLKNEKAIDYQRIFGRAESSECERARNIKQSAEVEGEACNGMQGLR